MTDVTQALKDAENTIRDFISFILSQTLGTDWENKCGVPPDRLARWKERKSSELKRQDSGAADERLIYYADFYDLKTILHKNWQHFSPALGDWKTTEVWLSELEKLRDPEAHRRELLPHQKNLILGIAGEFRTRIARYRSRKETSDSYYPRIEFAADNLGNICKPDENKYVRTGLKLRPGDVLEFVVTASDPLGEDIQYQFTFGAGSPGHSYEWTKENTFTFVVEEKHVNKLCFARLVIRSKRKYHAHSTYDDDVEFTYEVLPPR
jgi:hypothetical protein